MSHLLYRIGHFAGRRPWRVLAAWVAIAAAATMLNISVGGAPDESFTLSGAESQRAADAIEDRFPQQTLNTSNVIFHSADGVTAPETKAAVEQAVNQLSEAPHVVDVHEPHDPRGPTISEDGKAVFATVAYDMPWVSQTALTDTSQGLVVTAEAQLWRSTDDTWLHYEQVPDAPEIDCAPGTTTAHWWGSALTPSPCSSRPTSVTLGPR